MEAVSMAEARSRFSELVSQAMAGERFIIRRRNGPAAALVGKAELERLERVSETAHRLALLLGQDPELLKQVESQQAHPALAAFGLWRDEEDWTNAGIWSRRWHRDRSAQR